MNTEVLLRGRALAGVGLPLCKDLTQGFEKLAFGVLHSMADLGLGKAAAGGVCVHARVWWWGYVCVGGDLWQAVEGCRCFGICQHVLCCLWV